MNWLTTIDRLPSEIETMTEPVPLQPVIVAHLFPEMRAELLRILGSLTDQQWEQPTVCEGWTVRDVALHLLGDDVGFLSGLRDRDGQYGEFDRWEDLVAFINAQNDLWVRAARRISRRLLIALLGVTGPQCHDYIASLDPYEPAGPVGWTGNDSDPTWLHIAREFTEHWMHHQHICEAVGITSLKDRRYRQPVLSTFVYALPHTYRQTAAPVDTLVRFQITGEGGGEWHLIRQPEAWRLYAGSDHTPASTVILDDDTAWRLFTRGLDRDEIRQRAVIEGDTALGAVALTGVAIIA
jgi:uncharacterized protein (TIGR03083 family)